MKTILFHAASRAREAHTATLLSNGMVLVAGGVAGGVIIASAELYDPASGSWTVTGSLNTGRFIHTATLLPSDKVHPVCRGAVHLRLIRLAA